MSAGSGRSAGQTLAEQFLALLGALAAGLLGALEELGEVGIAVALGVLAIRLEAQHVRQALLREPDDVVVLVLGAGDLTGLGLAGRHASSPWLRVRSRSGYPGRPPSFHQSRLPDSRQRHARVQGGAGQHREHPQDPTAGGSHALSPRKKKGPSVPTARRLASGHQANSWIVPVPSVKP